VVRPLGARAARGLLLFLLLAASAPPLFAVAPVLWTLETFEDFERGKAEGVAVAAGGELVLAPALKPLKMSPLEETAEPFLWSQAVDGKGNLYVGGGNGGRIYRVPRGGVGSVYYETGDLAVHALAVDRSDVLYAATSPQGKIYRITGEGKGEVYYQPEDRYTWALVVGPKGELYAATGERGVVYRIPMKGKGEKFFDSEEFHVVALAFDASGGLLAGTDGKGLLYRIGPDGRASVLYDSALREINAIAVDPKGAIYAAAIGVEGEPALPPLPPAQPAAAGTQPPPAGTPVQPPMPIPGIESGATATVRVTASASGPPGVPAGTPPRSEVYRIETDGTVSVYWSSASEVVYSLLIDASGRPVIGSGEPGRIRALAGPQESTLLARVPESQVTSLARGPGQQIFAASSNVGRVYVLDAATSESGTYMSPPRDAETSSRWGRISWRASVPAGARVELTTRSGNSGTPDASWSDWSAAYAAPEGSVVSSPPARFLQWRARMTRPSGASSPTLQAVSVAYLQANLAPTLTRVSVQPPGVVRERGPYQPETEPQDLAYSGIRVLSGAGDLPVQTQSSIPEKKIYVRGLRSVEWDSDDPNGDVLSFDLFFRGEGESTWKPLARGLRERYFAFDSTQLPDGLYRVRVEASDAPANPAGQAKSASLMSDPFLVDNTPPSVQVVARKAAKGSSITIEAAAADTLGPVARAEYSVDAARWVPLAPVDGVSDSRAESYSVTIDGLRPGEHTVIVKVTDLLGNVGAGKATFTSD
jgi:hypothetical protein